MNLLRQLRNDEKRARFISVSTIRGEDLASLDTYQVSKIPGNGTTVARVWAEVIIPFAAGSTIDWGYVNGEIAGSQFFNDADLTVTGLKLSDTAVNTLFNNKKFTGVTPNQAAVDSTNGIIKLFIEYTEDAVRTGSYSA